MASNKASIKRGTIPGTAPGLGRVLLKIIGVGVGGGAILIGGSKAVGEKLLIRQAEGERKLEEKRAADREEARRITENSTDSGL